MSVDSLLNEIEQYLSISNTISENRKYWLVRTQGGQFYDTFRDNGFIAINYDEIGYSQIDKIKKTSKNQTETLVGIKQLAEKLYQEESRPGLIASQIYKFAYEVKKNDVVIIPGTNSGAVTFGYIKATPLIEASKSELKKTDCPYVKRKAVRWVKSQSRDTLDPYLYRVMQAHQAINDISTYSDIVERSLGNFYIKNGSANLILDVATYEKIHATDIFSLGYNLLRYAQNFFDETKLPLSVNEVEVKINVNSPGKIQFKSPSRGTLILIGLLIVGLNGGGFKVNVPGKFDLDLSTPGLIQTVIDYQNNSQDRLIKENLVKGLDSLKVVPPDDVITVIKQFSTNKDLPK